MEKKQPENKATKDGEEGGEYPPVTRRVLYFSRYGSVVMRMEKSGDLKSEPPQRT